VTTYASPKLGAYAALAGLGLLAAVVSGRAEAAALAAPFVIACVVGLSLSRTPDYEIRAVLDRPRATEGDVVYLDIEIATRRSLAWLQVFAPLPKGLDSSTATVLGVHLASNEHRRVRVPIQCRRWGVFHVATLWMRSHDALGFFVSEEVLHVDAPLRVYPRPEYLQTLVQPRETQMFAGNQLSRRNGEGIEFADIRPFTPGDVVRHVNWRLTTRLGELYVNGQHLERNADVVLFLDTFSDIQNGEGSTLDMAVRATASLAEHYLHERDRVGLLSFGGSLRWMLPNIGIRQAYRIVDSLLDTETFVSFAWKGIDHVPPRTLPPEAMVLAVSPLLDERTIQVLLDLRGRGFDLAVLEISPIPFVETGPQQLDQLAVRIWRLHREALRTRLRSLGVAVATWTPEHPLEPALEEVSRFRRSLRSVRA
jgi:uncharacterized protein (DUF58 family)